MKKIKIFLNGKEQKKLEINKEGRAIRYCSCTKKKDIKNLWVVNVLKGPIEIWLDTERGKNLKVVKD